jgi:hypothetical protein
LRLLPLAVVLALVLSACGLSTDTVATVGGDRITRGELNAFGVEARASARNTGNPEPTDAEVLQTLVFYRLLELSGREQKLSVTPQEVEAETATQIAAINNGGNQAREQQLVNLATATARDLRPLVNAYGGAVIPDAELQTAVREQIARLIDLLNARGTTMPVGYTLLPERAITDQAIIFRNDFAGRGIALPPAELEPVIIDLVQQLRLGRFTGVTAADDLQRYLAGQGESKASYERIVRLQLLVEKMFPDEYDVAYFQSLTTDSREKANEAVRQARAGTPFADLIRAYHLPTIQTTGPENLGTTGVPVALFPQQLRSAFKSFAAGEVGEPLASADGSQFSVYRIARIERRAPTNQERSQLLELWFQELPTKYPVVYVDKALEPQQVIP